MSDQTTTIHGDQLGLFRVGGVSLRLPAQTAAHAQAIEAAELKRIRQRDEARAVAKGTETSRAAVLSLNLSDLEGAIVKEIRQGGPGTAEELGDRLTASASWISAWGPQTMSGACNRLLRKRRICRRDKRPGRSGRLAWIWELRSADTLAG